MKNRPVMPQAVRDWADGLSVETLGASKDGGSALYRRSDGAMGLRDAMPTKDGSHMDAVIFDAPGGGHVVCSPDKFDDKQKRAGLALDSSAYTKLLSATLLSMHAAAEARNTNRVEEMLLSRGNQNIGHKIDGETVMDVAKRSMSAGEYEIVRNQLTRRIAGEIFQGVGEADFKARCLPVMPAADLAKKVRIPVAFTDGHPQNANTAAHTIGTLSALRRNNAALESYLNLGGDPKAKMPSGMSLYEQAAAHGNSVGLEILEKKGAKLSKSAAAYMKAAAENPALAPFDAEQIAHLTRETPESKISIR
jgi:hypothetical protein